MEDGWSGAAAAVEAVGVVVSPQGASHGSVHPPPWAHPGADAPPADAGSTTAARPPRHISAEFGDGERPGESDRVLPRWDAVFLIWNDYEDSGTVLGMGTFPFLSRLLCLFLTLSFTLISAPGGEAGPRPHVEAVVVVRVASESCGMVGRLLARNDPTFLPRTGFIPGRSPGGRSLWTQRIVIDCSYVFDLV